MSDEHFSRVRRFDNSGGGSIADLHRAASLEFADDGGIAPLSGDFDPVPLTQMRPNWRAAWPWLALVALLVVGACWVVA